MDKKQVKIEYLPTHLMLAKFSTNPFQGWLFSLLRKYVMGWAPLTELIVSKDESEQVNMKLKRRV